MMLFVKSGNSARACFAAAIIAAAPAAGQGLDISTFAYFPQRPNPFLLTDPFGFYFARDALSANFADALRREYNANWGNAAVGQATALNATRLPGTGAITNGIIGRGVTVAVIDSGIDATFANLNNPSAGFSYVHPEFAGRLDLRSRRFLSNGNVDLGIGDTDGHGTHVAGTILGAINGQGFDGIAPGATLLSLSGVGRGLDSVAALDFAARQGDVLIVNGSYGPSAQRGERTWTTGDLGAEPAAVRNALAAGKIMVYATGNDFQTAPIQAQNPTGIPLYPFIRPENARQGAYDDGGRNYNFSEIDRLPGFIVAVTNLDRNFVISADSNRCGVAAAWCISAPGGGVADAANPQNNILSAYPISNTGDTPQVGPSGRGYAYINGTSMATPHVSGVLAVLAEAYPNYTPRLLVRLMFATADDLGAPGVDPIYGHGLVRLDRALNPGPDFNLGNFPFVTDIVPGQPQFWTAPINTPRQFELRSARTAADGFVRDLVIAGTANFGGGVLLTSGDLEVDGQLTAPFVRVGSNGTLVGDGDIYSNVTVDGRLEPGTEGPAKLSVFGNLTLNPGSAFIANIDGQSTADGPGAYSKLLVSGAGNVFTAGGKLDLHFRDIFEGASNTYRPVIGSTFRIVEALNGARVAGRFNSLAVEADSTGDTGLPAGSRIDVLYAPTSIVTAITPLGYATLPNFGVALTSAQRALAGALDRARPGVNAPMSDAETSVFSPLYGLSTDQISDALTQLSGRDGGVAVKASVAAAQQFSNALGNRMSSLRSGASEAQNALRAAIGFSSNGPTGLSAQALSYAPSAPAWGNAPAARTGVWIHGFGLAASIAGDASGPGSRASGGGVIFGADHEFAPGLTGGVAGAFSRASVRSGAYSGTVDSYLGAIYGSATSGAVEFDVLAGMSGGGENGRRTINFAGLANRVTAKTGNLGLLAAGELGYRFTFNAGASPGWFKPFAALSYADVRRNGFTETGAGALGLTFPGQTFGALNSVIGARLGLDVLTSSGLTLRPELKLGWVQELSRTSQLNAALLGQLFSTPLLQAGRSGALTAFNLTGTTNGWLTVNAGYSSEWRARGKSHQVNAGLRVIW